MIRATSRSNDRSVLAREGNCPCASAIDKSILLGGGVRGVGWSGCDGRRVGLQGALPVISMKIVMFMATGCDSHWPVMWCDHHHQRSSTLLKRGIFLFVLNRLTWPSASQGCKMFREKPKHQIGHRHPSPSPPCLRRRGEWARECRLCFAAVFRSGSCHVHTP